MDIKKEIIFDLHNKYKDKINIVKMGIIVNDVFDTMIKMLLDKGYLSLHNIGTFKIVKRKGRKQYVPSINEIIDVPDKKTVTFKIAKNLSKEVNRG